MPTISESLAIAKQHFEARHFQAAEQIYRQVLAADPNNTRALHYLGLVAYETGRPDAAVVHIRRAIELNASDYAVHANFGRVLQALGKLPEAIDSFQRALQLNSTHPKIHNQLGDAFKELGQLDEAAGCFRRAIELSSNTPEFHLNLGTIFQAQGKLNDAVNCYRKAVELQPLLAKPYYNLGTAFQSQEKLEEAAYYYNRAIELEPNLAQAHNNLGNVYKELGRLKDAVNCYQRALRLSPTYAGAYSNLGNACLANGNLDEAIACFQRALQLRPLLPETHNSLGTAFKDQGKNDEALHSYGKAVELSPNYAQAHANRSMLRLLKGDYQQGWIEYEWRWRTKQLGELAFSQPQWNGERLGGSTILVHAEQGLGDTLQFIRYAALVKRQHSLANIVVRCQAPLVQLLSRCQGINQWVAEADELPPFNVHSPLLSLPRIFQTAVETIPTSIPYIYADAALVAYWRQRLRDVRGLRVGINWQGRQGPGEFRRRDVPLEYFASLAEFPGINLISLQKGEGRDELLRSNLPIIDPGADLDTVHGRFMDTAAIIMNLDLVITSDTSLPHLAAALGVPVWVALPFVSSWQWMCERKDSPWYPTARLFRQPVPRDWTGVFENICGELRKLV